MKTSLLKDLVIESIHSYIREIDSVSEVAAIESKINEATKSIEERKAKLAKADELNESGLIDSKIVKKIQKEVELLEKYKSKQEALLEKKKSKMTKKGEEVENEVIDETSSIEETSHEDDMSMEEELNLESSDETMDETPIELNENVRSRFKKLAGIINS